MPLYELNDKRPQIHPDVAYISPHAIIIGDVRIGKDTSVFDNVVIEGDIAPIVIGDRVNIQSLTVIHTAPSAVTTIGNDVTIGHRSIIHWTQIEDNVTIGIGAIVASYTRIGRGAIIGEGALVPQKMQTPALSLAIGVPAKVIRTLGGEAENQAIDVAGHYMEHGRERAQFMKLMRDDHDT